MPAVFVHGVPDTHRVWSRVLHSLGRRDVVAFDLPGFGCPVPDGFGATKEEYLEWLVRSVEGVAADAGEPVDLVGHDWGSLLTMRLASVRPDLVRTWAAGGGPVHPDWEWHEMAKLWQTPEVGEQVVEALTPESYAAGAAGFGLRGRSEATAECEHSARLPNTSLREPGRMLTHHTARLVADAVGCESVVFEGCGHWWPVERPAETAAALDALWAATGAA